MKKILSILLAVAMLATCAISFASCGDNADGVVKVIDIPLTQEEYAFAVQKGDTELLTKLNEFLKTNTDNGKIAEIMNKYFGDGTPSPVTSATTLKTDGSQLVVATNAAFEPFEYKKGENYYGFDLEVMALFAQSLGKELYINNMAFDAVCLSVSAAGGEYEDEDGNKVTVAGGVCDIAAAGLTVNDTRKQILDFSTSYYNASQVLITAASDTTFDECKDAAAVEAKLKEMTKTTKVGVQNGTTGAFYCNGDEGWGFEGFAFETVGYASGALAVQDIINGNIKYVVIDEAPAKAITAQINAAN